jgi:hypothetical protein
MGLYQVQNGVRMRPSSFGRFVCVLTERERERQTQEDRRDARDTKHSQGKDRTGQDKTRHDATREKQGQDIDIDIDMAMPRHAKACQGMPRPLQKRD